MIYEIYLIIKIIVRQERRKNNRVSTTFSLIFYYNKGCNVVVSLVSPYKDQRDSFKLKLGDSIKELYINTTEIRGREQFHVSNYESPTENYLDINTTNISVKECITKIKSYVG